MTNTEKEIATLEEQIKASKQKLAELRRKVPPKPVEDYAFRDSAANPVRLSQLFGQKDTLVVIHNMGIRCSHCTMWADGFNGILKHLEDRAAVVLETMDEPHVTRQFALDRGWGFRTVSSKDTPFRQDMGYAKGPNEPWPGLSVFVRDSKGAISRVSDAQFGPGDNFCVVWDVFDMLPQAWTGDEGDYYYAPIKR